MKSKRRFTVMIDYSVRYDTSTEYDWSRRLEFCKNYELDKVQQRSYMEVFSPESFTKDEAVHWAKKWIMEGLRKNSPTKTVAVRWDKVLV